MPKDRCPGREPEAPAQQMTGHNLSHLPPSRKRGEALRRIGEALLVLADLDDAPPVAVDTATPMPAARIVELREGVTAGWLRSHISSTRGARRQPLYRLSDVDAALASGAQPPRPPRKSRSIPLENEDPLEQMLRHGELVSRRGSR